MSVHTSVKSYFHLVHSWKRQLSEQLVSLGYDVAPMHMRAMKIMTKQSPCSSIEIAKFLRRDKAQVTRLVNTLIKEGLLSKASNPEDKRSHFLTLTGSGKDLMNKVSEIDQAILLQMARGISNEDLEKFNGIAEKMADNLAR
ncbi:MarR family transcriptional regulator [Vibrio sp. YMD68]|uniref:MarR family winged helix-turn-helix transcriptional regulator n=1 Tax=Vibrio sp. YMD68 TaxID=3042300 RepID=UPI00249C700F|nr:MarR family transcriptional regulator [Vibrio sp. YMD68]WGV98976.1 MarR family transcriptional regulator [Vibrio sp. YMD68]